MANNLYMNTITIKPKEGDSSPYGYATGRNGGFNPKRIEVYPTQGTLVRLDVFSEGLVHNPPIVLALHPEEAFDLAQAILVACRSYK